jgi:predicted HAD superfamily Cof-like phosphohydrolase
VSTKLSLIKPSQVIPIMDISEVIPIQGEFMEVFSIPFNEKTAKLYLTLIEEEHEEWVEDFFSDAPSHKELKELADLLYVTAGYALQLGYKSIKAIQYFPTETWDWAITELVSDLASGKKDKVLISKLIYCLFAHANERNWDLMEAYRRVHKSNMSKLTEDGKVLRREDGKVQKSNLYKEPDLKDLTGEY